MVIETGLLRGGLLAVRDAFVNFYVLEGPEGLLCIDAGWRAGNGRRAFAALGLDPAGVEAVLLTHGHWDHALGCGAFPGARIFRGPDDGQEFRLAGLQIRVMALPGHTGDSRAYLTEQGELFTGDALRLRKGRALPPWSGLRPGSREGLSRLARMDGLAGLYTGHWGHTLEPRRALAAWRDDHSPEAPR